jgi:2-polyprenyl-3-methyl-5-hydroxy-6-metoxy-1,4-benzoquinol methylase
VGEPVERCDPDEYQRRYDLIAGDHVSYHRSHGTNPWMSSEPELRAWTAAHVRALVPEGGTVLDCGCGIGLLLADLATTYDAAGVDIGNPYIDYCREQGLDVRYGWLEDLPFPDGTFDAVVCVDVLEHVLDPERVAGEVSRVVKPGGGVVVARVPTPGTADVGGGGSYGFPIHLQALTADELTVLFNATLVVSDQMHSELLVGLRLDG